MPGTIARSGSQKTVGALIDAGNLAAADSACAAAVAWCRDAGDMVNLLHMLMMMADLDVQHRRHGGLADRPDRGRGRPGRRCCSCVRDRKLAGRRSVTATTA
jgi:hypothetical protein